MNKNMKNHLPKILAALPAAALLLTVFAGALVNPKKAWSDDRDLLGTSGDKPYVFFIIDSSSSMRRFIGNEWVPGANDDPNSKIYQAKKAVYEVIDQVGENALFGFSIFDISEANPVDRHWLYTPESEPSWFSDAEFAGGVEDQVLDQIDVIHCVGLAFEVNEDVKDSFIADSNRTRTI